MSDRDKALELARRIKREVVENPKHPVYCGSGRNERVDLARALIAEAARADALQQELRSTMPLRLAASQYLNGYACAKCGALVLSDQHVESMRGKNWVDVAALASKETPE